MVERPRCTCILWADPQLTCWAVFFLLSQEVLPDCHSPCLRGVRHLQFFVNMPYQFGWRCRSRVLKYCFLQHWNWLWGRITSISQTFCKDDYLLQWGDISTRRRISKVLKEEGPKLRLWNAWTQETIDINSESDWQVWANFRCFADV